jgi:hypothetical protein
VTDASPVPEDRVSSEDLRDALERALGEQSGSTTRITRLERSPCVFTSSFALEELKVELEGGSTLDLMFKDLGESGLSERARAAKPEFLYEPVREIAAYGSILAPAELGAPAFHGSAVDPSAGRFWLFIENVHGPALWQIGEFDVWEKVARWAATMHGRFSGTDIPASESLVPYGADLYRLWLQRAVEFADLWEARRSGARKAIGWLAAVYDSVVERLAALPSTFIHGELYASNVLVVRSKDATRVCPIDWEMAAVGPGLIDLAALAMGWAAEERVALATAYRDAYPESDRPPALDDFLQDLDCARLHLAVQWLGWAPDWRPPRSHRRDWVGEALGIAEELGL